MNSTSISLASRLTFIQNDITIYVLTTILIFGNIGNIGNLIIFSQKLLRANVCSWYFIIFSIGNIITINFGCSTRIISLWTGYDLVRISIIFCKLRIYFTIFGLSLSRNFLSLISIDRWMITSRNVGIRRLSSSKIAWLLIITTILFWAIFTLYVAIGYEIDINSNCVKRTDDIYELIYIIFALFSIICPLFIMIIFSILAILNVQKLIQRRVIPAIIINLNVVQPRHYRRKDLPLIKLSLVQVTVYIILNLVDMYNTIYGFTSLKTIKSSDQTAIDGFIGIMGIYLLYLYCAVSCLYDNIIY